MWRPDARSHSYRVLRPAVNASRDLREGGRWTPAQRWKNHGLWLLAIVALAGIRLLPQGRLRTLGRALGRAAHACAWGARRTARDNVSRVFPTLGRREQRDLVLRCFVCLGELLADTVAMLRPGTTLHPLPLSEQARAVIEKARAEGRGVVFASAHLGPWERVAASLVAAGVPLVALARESYDPRFSRLYEKLRGAHGVRVVWRATPGAAARILRTLRGGGVLGVPMDLRSRVPSCDVPFLGSSAPTAVGPARIALRARAAVVVGTVAPGPDGSLRITATRIDSSGLGPDHAGALELTTRINAELSRRILALPHGWVWMHDRWSAGTEV
jgi:Kdo2-lipid IVA lauroyltransferase/acyltransferase